MRFVTLEQGVYGVGPGLADDELVATRVRAASNRSPSSQLVIANDFVTDLPERLWAGDEQTAQMLRAGRALDALDLLPAPFPIEEILDKRDLRHVELLYGIGGLSYGNVSARYLGDDLHGVPDPDGPVYWMSASGVDKADLRLVGEHILLVRGFDPERETMVLSVPPDVKPRRVSVDAIEHWMIYREHPERRRDPARARLDRRDRLDRGQLPVRHAAARGVGRRPRARRARSRRARSSGYAITA